MFSIDFIPDYPTPADVLLGVSYGANELDGPYVGTLNPATPPPIVTGGMAYRVVTAALINILGFYVPEGISVIGYRRQVKSSETRRTIQVFYSSGDFPKSAGRQTGPAQHNMTFSIGLTVSAPAKVDLSVINNPSSTPAQISAALLALQEGAAVADNLFDELAEIVYQILMDGNNFDLGLPVGSVSKRWVENMRKDTPAPEGALVVLTGVVQYSCNAAEDILGAIGTAGGIISTVVDIDGDDVEKTGVEVINP